MTQFDLSKQPTASGVYLMKDDRGEILYVGKAKNLRARLRSYMKADRDTRPQIKFMMERAAQIETIVTDTEKEALILENTLIKKHRPRYNIHLRDDKTFVSLRIDLNEEFPMLHIVRKVRQDGARYFGPFASASALRQTLKEIYRIFPLRHYPMAQCRQRGRPCLFHQIDQCSAPCLGLISQKDYQQLVSGVMALLEGRQGEVINLLRQRMQVASEQQKYEQAAFLRDQAQAIRYGTVDQDVIGLCRQEGEVEIAMLFYRQGKLSARRNYNLVWRLDEEALLTDFLLRFYDHLGPAPDELVLPFAIEGMPSFAEWISERHQKKVSIFAPQRGDRRRLVEMANRNAQEAIKERGRSDEAKQKVLNDIQAKLQLRRWPHRMECFDISTIHGEATVASMAVVINGEPDSSEYRHYRVKSVVGTDDYAALREVIGRRLQRGVAENNLPDLILIDGGKGQLGVLMSVINDLELTGRIDVAGIAKSRVKANVRGRIVERSEERFFIPERKNPVLLRPGTAALFLLERLRDEAHRFAIEHHRKVRGKAQLKSSLSDIPGVGPKRQKALLKHFGSLKRIKAASLEELQAMPGLPGSLAEAIYRTYHQDAEASTRG